MNPVTRKPNVQQSEPVLLNLWCSPASAGDLLRPQQDRASSPKAPNKEVGLDGNWASDFFPFNFYKRCCYQRLRFTDFKTSKLWELILAGRWMQFPVATHISICLSSTLNCPLIGFLEYPGLLPMHSPYCSQSDLFELKILSCRLPSNFYFNHFEVFPFLLREILKSETRPTSPKMSLSPIQSNFTCSYCVCIISFL